VAGGRGSRERLRPRARAEAAVSTLPETRSGFRFEIARLTPSGRSVLVGLLILVAALAAYGVARSSSAFAIRTFEVRGAPTEVAADISRALASERGETLLAVDLADLELRVEALPWVADATFDRAFPNTLSVTIVTEQPAAVLRQGAFSWLVGTSGRVLATLEPKQRLRLPRIWLKRGVEVAVGQPIGGIPEAAVRAVAPLTHAPLPARVASVRASDTELTLVLRSGFEVRLGDGSERALKLEIARRILPALGTEGYLDVSVPKHPVAAPTLDPQVEVDSSTSTLP
jgi:cell division protein FtsQ